MRSLSVSAAAASRTRLGVEQRLAHAHEDDIGQPLAETSQPLPPEADLVDDLGNLEVALEAELAGGAERTADGTPGLAGDADRRSRPAATASRVTHQHGLDQTAIVEPMKGLVGQAVIGRLDIGLGKGAYSEVGGQFGPQSLRQRVQFVG